MAEWLDYYKILQVHYLAEGAVVESAYKKLSKMYHPDVNNNHDADEKMKLINLAYEVLSVPITRKQYFLKWIEKNSTLNISSNDEPNKNKSTFSYDPTKGLLIEYFRLIAERKFHLAYNLLSKTDRENITKTNFVKWQTKVSEVFVLKQWDCIVKNIYSDITHQDNYYALLVVFLVQVVELNYVMDRIEEDEFTKSVVLENNEWRLFLGYTDLDSMIEKFDELARFKKKKLNERKKTQRQLNIDPYSGLFNRRGFMERALKEQNRHNRYGNAFSIILCEFYIQDQTIENREYIFKQMGTIIKSSLRSLDIPCRWKDNRFYLLLPETNGDKAQLVMEKLKIKLNHHLSKGSTTGIEINYVVEEQTVKSLNTLILSLAEQMKCIKWD